MIAGLVDEIYYSFYHFHISVQWAEKKKKKKESTNFLDKTIEWAIMS